MLSSYNQIIHIYYDKYLSSGVAQEEQRFVGFGHVKLIWWRYWVIFECKDLGAYLRSQRGFLSRHTACGCVLDLKHGGCTVYTSSSNSTWRKAFLTSIWWSCHPLAAANTITVRAGVIFASGAKVCHKSDLIPIDGAVGVVVHFEYSPTSYCLLVMWRGDEIPCLVLGECLHLLIHRFDPSWVLSGFWKVFQFSGCCHLRHKCIVICHVVVVAESDDYVLLSGGTTWCSWCPHGRHIQSTILTFEWVSWFVSIWVFVLKHFGISFVRFGHLEAPMVY